MGAKPHLEKLTALDQRLQHCVAMLRVVVPRALENAELEKPTVTLEQLFSERFDDEPLQSAQLIVDSLEATFLAEDCQAIG